MNIKQTIVIGADHAGFDLKTNLTTYLQNKGYTVLDKGCFSTESVDYPDFAHEVTKQVTADLQNTVGILICGSGQGMAITANKHNAIRAALCFNTELATLVRQHNNANVLCLPARFVSEKDAFEITDTFLSTLFEAGRHQTRVSKI